jgi:hypothetical protein
MISTVYFIAEDEPRCLSVALFFPRGYACRYSAGLAAPLEISWCRMTGARIQVGDFTVAMTKSRNARVFGGR